MILCSLVLGNNIKYEREHCNKDNKEQHEHKKISNNVNKHSNNETEWFYNSHVEESFDQTSKNGTDHNAFCVDMVWFHVDLIPDWIVAHPELENVYIVHPGGKVCCFMLQNLISVIV